MSGVMALQHRPLSSHDNALASILMHSQMIGRSVNVVRNPAGSVGERNDGIAILEHAIDLDM
jgi:hypothetical protein